MAVQLVTVHREAIFALARQWYERGTLNAGSHTDSGCLTVEKSPNLLILRG